MTIMVTELHDALLSAGADHAKAESAATALANYDSRFNKVETDLAVVKWTLGLVEAGVIALVMKAFL